MSAAAERSWWTGRKKLKEDKPAPEPVKNVVLHLKRIVSWQKLLWIGIILGWFCVGISLKQSIEFGLAQEAYSGAGEKVATAFTFALFIVCAYLSAYFVALNWSAKRTFSAWLMIGIMFIGEGISIFTSTAMFMTDTFSGIQAEVDNSAKGKALMAIANARIKSASGQLENIGEGETEGEQGFLSTIINDEASQAQYEQLDVASAEVENATDASALSPLKQALDVMNTEAGISQFAWSLAKAFFLTLFPLTMTIMISNLNGKRNLTIDMDEGDEVEVKK